MRLLLGESQKDNVCHDISPELSLVIRLFESWIVAREGSSIGMQYLGLAYYRRRSIKIYFFTLFCLFWPFLVDRAKIPLSEDLRGTSMSSRSERNFNDRVIEHLKGANRQQIFHVMRQKMVDSVRSKDNRLLQGALIQRAKRPSCKKTSNEWLSSYNVCLVIRKGLKKICEKRSVSFPTPHVLTTQNNIDPHERGAFYPSDDAMLRNAMRLETLFEWLLRVNIALFKVNGYYPTITHRITGLTIEKDDSCRTKVIANSPNYHTVGFLILLGSFSKVTKVAMDFFLDRWYSWTSCNLHEVQNVSHHLRSTTSSLQQYTVPFTQNNVHVTELNSVSEEVCCVICMNPRQSSAASTSCGHVFCWYCIHQWIATVKPECPLCRKPCQHQEVISLCNYCNY